uniref:Pyrroline-5-carboxylate reductase catalytic N-terminal domain-containing protein n=1 Tax=Emiliania huxleyi TaxID=2903 RepID=A0A6V2T9N2_EMIHU
MLPPSLLSTILVCSAAVTSGTTLGFVGVGVMNEALVRGLCTLEVPPEAVVLSPRGAAKAASLSEDFEAATVAADNQQVLDRSDIIFLGVLPAQLEAVCRELRFEPRHTVVSLVSTAPLALLRECCSPAGTVMRAIPLPPVAQHRGATVMCPPHPVVTPLFESLGTAVAVEAEETLLKLMPVTALMGQLYAQQLAAQSWLQEQGVDAGAAARWVGAVYHTVSYDSATPGPDTFASLVEEQTPGGLNEQVLREMREAGASLALRDSLDDVLARIEGRPAAARERTAYSSSPADPSP